MLKLHELTFVTFNIKCKLLQLLSCSLAPWHIILILFTTNSAKSDSHYKLIEFVLSKLHDK